MNQKKIVKEDDFETYKRLKEFYMKSDWDLWKYIFFDKSEDVDI